MLPKSMINYLNNLSIARLNIVDVGCCIADFKIGLQPLLSKPAFWIGIDPYDHGVGEQYDAFINKAILDVPDERLIDFYMHADFGCSSTLRMRTELLTYDVNEFDRKWFVNNNRDIKTLKQVKTVPADSLKNVLKPFKLADIHVMKIDAQGVDIDIVKSAGQFIHKTHIVMIESIISKNKDLTLYEGQSLFEDDEKILNKLGFELFSMVDYSIERLALECNAFFYNTKLVPLEPRDPIVTASIDL